MEDLNTMDLFTLVDLLAKHTNQYMKMFKEGATEQEYANCKKAIKNLTAEIEYRKQKTQGAKKAKVAKDGTSM